MTTKPINLNDSSLSREVAEFLSLADGYSEDPISGEVISTILDADGFVSEEEATLAFGSIDDFDDFQAELAGRFGLFADFDAGELISIPSADSLVTVRPNAPSTPAVLPAETPVIDDATKICTEFYDAGFFLDMGPRLGGEIRADAENRDLYLSKCAYDIKWTADVMQLKGIEGPHWTPAQAKTVADYVRTHGLKGVVLSSRSNSPFNQVYMSTTGGGRLQVAIASRTRSEKEAILFVLDHETGHLKDIELVGQLEPRAAALLEKDQATPQEAHFLVNTYLKIIRNKVPQTDIEEFDALTRKLFVSATPDEFGNILELFGEALRYGEEISDPRLRDFVFSAEYPRFKKQTGGTARYLTKFEPRHAALAAAELKAAGLYEEFKNHPDCDVNSLENVDPELTRFFYLAITASSAYFPRSGE